jgi:hypothetical protein
MFLKALCFSCLLRIESALNSRRIHVTVFRAMATASNTEAVLVVLCVVFMERLYQQINDVAK